MEASGAFVQGRGHPEPQTLRLLTGFSQVSPACSWKAFPACFLRSNGGCENLP